MTLRVEHEADRAAGIMRNCALGAECQCLRAAKPWNCQNWGRSSLGNPAIVGRDPYYGGSGQKVGRPTKKV
jgi:hypothetical protein